MARRRNSKGALVSFYALVALALALAGLAVLYGRWRAAESAASVRETQARAAADRLEKARASFEAALERATNRAVDEAAQHGGYAEAAVPPEAAGRVPYWSLRGKVVNVPAVDAMEGMLAHRIASLLGDELSAQREGPLRLGAPSVSVRLYDAAVVAEAEATAEVAYLDEVQRAALSARLEAPLRLKALRDLAERYARNYTGERTIEQALLNGLVQDPRIPAPPGLVMRNVACTEQAVLAYKRDLLGSMRDNARLATALEQRRLASSGLAPRDTDWSLEPGVGALAFSLLANKGVTAEGRSWESDTTVHLVPARMPHGSLEGEGVCSSYYTVAYKVEFPVVVTLVDLSRPGSLKGAAGSAATRPLALSFAIGVFVENNQPDAIDLNLTARENVTDLCTGSCSLRVVVENSRSGRVSLGLCSYPYRGEVFQTDRAPCGLQTLVVESGDPIGMATFTKQVAISANLTVQVAFKEKATVSGRVSLRERAYCAQSQTVRELGERPAGFVDGEPPMYVKVVLQPLGEGAGEARSTVVDEDGRFVLTSLEPGRYLVLARSSLDLANIPSYKVQPAVLLHEVPPGQSELAISLEPLLMERVNGTYVPVSARKDC